VPARLINIKYITIRAEKVAIPVTALQMELTHSQAAISACFLVFLFYPWDFCYRGEGRGKRRNTAKLFV